MYSWFKFDICNPHSTKIYDAIEYYSTDKNMVNVVREIEKRHQIYKEDDIYHEEGIDPIVRNIVPLDPKDVPEHIKINARASVARYVEKFKEFLEQEEFLKA